MLDRLIPAAVVSAGRAMPSLASVTPFPAPFNDCLTGQTAAISAECVAPVDKALIALALDVGGAIPDRDTNEDRVLAAERTRHLLISSIRSGLLGCEATFGAGSHTMSSKPGRQSKPTFGNMKVFAYLRSLEACGRSACSPRIPAACRWSI